MWLLKRLKLRRVAWLKGLTLVELFIAISIFAIMVVAFSNIDTFSRYHLVTSDKRAKLQNDVTYVLEHIGRNAIGTVAVGAGGSWTAVGGAIGDVTNPTSSYPVSLTTVGSNNAVVINIDYNNNGKWDGTGGGDRQIAYSYSGSPNYQIWYYPNASVTSPCPGSACTVLTASRIQGNFSTTTTDPTYRTYDSATNYFEVQIGACWDPASSLTCGTPDNPAISAKTRIYMPSASTH